MRLSLRRTWAGLCLLGMLFSGCGDSSRSTDFVQSSVFTLGGGQGDGADSGPGAPHSPNVTPGTGQPVPFNPPDNPIPPTRFLYITEGGENSLGIYNAETYDFIDRIPVGTDPSGLSYDTERERILVGLFDGTLVTLNANDLGETPLTTVAVPSASVNLIYDSVFDAIWVSSFNMTEKMAILAAATLAPLSGSPMTDPDMIGSSTMLLDPAGALLYVTQSVLTAGGLSVVDRATRTLLHHISIVDPSGDLNDSADGLAYHPTFQQLYVGNGDIDTNDDDTVVVLDASQDPPVIIQRAHCGQGPSALAVDLNHNRVYATNYNSPTGGLTVYSVVDTGTPLSFLQTLPTGRQPLTVVYDEDRDRILVTNFQDATLSVFDGETLDEWPGSPFSVGDGPNQPMLRPLTSTP